MPQDERKAQRKAIGCHRMALEGLAVILWPRNRGFRPNPGHRMSETPLGSILWPAARKAKAIRFSTLDAICNALDCQPGDLLEYRE